MPQETGQRYLSAIMFSDIVGYSKMMGDDERGTLALLQEHNNLLVPVIQRRRGTILKFIGDAILSSFDSASDAVHCAVEIQQVLSERNKSANKKLLVRIGIHIGDVTRRGGDVFGDGVNIAARIQPLAEPGGICISQTVYHIVRAQQELHMVSLGPHNLKNIKESVHLYKVQVGEESEGVRLPWRRILLLALAAACFFAVAGLLRRGGIPLDLRLWPRRARRSGEFSVVVAPFSGMDPETDKDGLILQSLIEQRLLELFPARTGVSVFKAGARAPRDAVQARALGGVPGAHAVIWGELLSLNGSLHIKPYLTSVPGSGFAGDAAGAPLQADAAGAAQFEQLTKDARAAADLAVLAAARFYQVKDPERSLALLQEVQPATARTLSAEGYIRLAQRHPDEAEALFQRSISMDPGFALAHEGLAEVLLRRHLPDQAISQFEKAAELDPNLPSPHGNLGVLYSNQGRHGKALEELKLAVSLAPRGPLPRLHLGAEYELQGDHVRAAQELFEALSLAVQPEQKAHAVLLYGVSMARSGRGAEARAAMDDFVAREREADWPLPIARFLVGKISEADLLDSAGAEPREANQRRTQAYFYMGAASALRGVPLDPARAREYYQKSADASRAPVIERRLALLELDPGRRLP